MGRYSVNVINGLSKYCDRIDVLVTKENEISNALDKKCHVYQILPSMTRLMNPLVLFYYALSIQKFIKKADIVHSLMDYPHAVLGALSTSIARKPFIISALGTYAIRPLNKKGIGSLLMRFAYRRANRILPISSFTKKEILKRCSLGNIEVIPLGVNYELFQKGRGGRERGEETIILSVGAVKPRKGFDISIQAISRLQKEKIKYLIVGDTHDTSFSNKLQEIITSEGLAGKVEFLGKVSDKELVRLYHVCDIFLLTPKNVDFNVEGFGLVYLEANACGKPVIGTYGCGAEDAIIDGYNGLLVPQDDPDATVKAINSLLNNPEVVQRMGENGRKRAKEMSWDNTVKKMLSIYEDALKTGKGR